MDKYGKCPYCNMDWDGGEIPKEDRKHYSPPYRWSKIVGVVCPFKDEVIHYECPGCKATFERLK
jgi:hypothetical protein